MGYSTTTSAYGGSDGTYGNGDNMYQEGDSYQDSPFDGIGRRMKKPSEGRYNYKNRFVGEGNRDYVLQSLLKNFLNK